MRRPFSAVLLTAAGLALAAAAAHAQTAAPSLLRPSLFQPPPGRLIPAVTPLPAVLGAGLDPGEQCRIAIRNAERTAGIPNELMAAIAHVESGRREPDGTVNPWPWSINAEGTGQVFETKAAAISAVRALQARGVRSIDVGCMQVNLMHHPDAFASLAQAFDPVANANYAARFLVQLHGETGAWPTATAWYHSATPALGADYQRKVMAVWPEEKQRQADTPSTTFASSYTSGYANGYHGGFAGGFANGFANGFGAPIAAGGLNRMPAARIIPLPAGITGRGLGAYRAAPIPVVSGTAPMPVPPRRPG